MPTHKVQRRTLSKVEQQLLKEKEEDTKRIKQQKKADWIKRQTEYKKQTKPAPTHVRVAHTPNQYNLTKRHEPVKIINKTVTNIITVTKKTTNSVRMYNWKCLNNSWADQSEFEDIRKQMLLRMAYKMMKC